MFLGSPLHQNPKVNQLKKKYVYYNLDFSTTFAMSFKQIILELFFFF
jgi:hypothetical protein